jgi:hypothetical protein
MRLLAGPLSQGAISHRQIFPDVVDDIEDEEARTVGELVVDEAAALDQNRAGFPRLCGEPAARGW